MAKTMHEWLHSGGHLPRFLRDFHDQKDVFKSIWEGIARRKKEKPEERDSLEGMNWVSSHIFAIDHFLWFMAQHGYTLQAAKKQKFEFFDLHETIREGKAEEAKAFRRMLDYRGHCLHPDTCNPDKGEIGCICTCNECTETKAKAKKGE